MSKEYDLVVLGGGTGGYVAAIRAAQLGLTVAIVEKEKLGGTCLHRGCIPSKALLESANVYRKLAQVGEFGITIDEYKFDMKQAQNRSSKIVEQLHTGIQTLMKKHQIVIYKGFGRILGPSIFSPLPGTISVEHDNGEENTMLIPKNIIIATGSAPTDVTQFQVDGEVVYNSDQLLQIESLPNSIAIVGGGVIGVEWASMLQDLGVEVTVIEQSEHILQEQDADVRREVQKALEKRGVNFFTNCTVIHHDLNESGTLSVTIKGEDEEQLLIVDKMLVAIGRTANIADIGLENTAISTKDGKIDTNEHFQTKESHIYAIGDCVAGFELAHVASAEGLIAVEHIAKKKPAPLDMMLVPMCVYSYPEVGSIGLTEEAAVEKGLEIKVGRFPFLANGKALIKGEPNGFIKIISDKQTDDVLGIHIVGPQATDLISEGALAKTLDASTWELSQSLRPHPSLAEVWTEVSLQADENALHL